MANFSYKDEVMAELHRAERMHEAEKERMIRQVEAKKVNRFNFSKAAAIWFGKKLVRLGMRLQKSQMTQYSS